MQAHHRSRGPGPYGTRQLRPALVPSAKESHHSPPPSFSSLSANMAYSLYHVQMANAWKERVNKEDLRAEQAAAVAAMLEKVRNKHAPQAGRHA